MGTNYYWRQNICSCCGRYDQLHICKSLVSFRGYFAEWNDSMLVITSWADWKKQLLSGGEVWDEYDVKLDTESFIASVEATAPEDRRRQYATVRGSYFSPNVGSASPGGDWLDAERFSFTGCEFS